MINLLFLSFLGQRFVFGHEEYITESWSHRTRPALPFEAREIGCRYYTVFRAQSTRPEWLFRPLRQMVCRCISLCLEKLSLETCPNGQNCSSVSPQSLFLTTVD